MSEARLRQALMCLQEGKLDQARAVCEDIVRGDPRNPAAWVLLGTIAMDRGDLPRAAEALRRSLERQPNQPAAWTNLGVALRGLAKPEEAVRCYDRALALQPDLPEALNNRANALLDLGRLQEALASCDRALQLRPPYPEALNNRGNVLRQSGRPQEALASLEQALKLRPLFAAAHGNRASALLDCERPEDALRACDTALGIDPHHAEAHNTRAAVLKRLGRVEEAMASVGRALQLQPRYAEALVNRGNLLLELGQRDEALASIDRALDLKPFDPIARYSRTEALRHSGRTAEALESYAQALALKPDLVAAINGRANLLAELGRYEEAAQGFARVIELAPDYELAAGHLLHCRLRLCDWTDYRGSVARLLASVERGAPAVAPLWCLALTDSAALQLACARIFSRRQVPVGLVPLSPAAPRRAGRLRVGYLSTDFREHPVARLLAGVLEQHDRTRFEIFGLSLSQPDGSELGRRVAAACDHFEDASRLTDADIAALIQRLEVDLLIDLNGWTQGMRSGVLARRAAAVQVSYLGYPGTSGAEYMDYLIADSFVIPQSASAHYSERVVALPGVFQANDDRRVVASRVPTRPEAGLPDSGIVLGSFNHAGKLTPNLFDVWTGFLRETRDSVLWLVADDAAARRNLRKEAERRGVEPGRLVFAQRTSYAEHLARLPLVDLALDTFPFNGGSTTSDILRAGVPVLTCAGDAFASRMTGSLLHSLGLPELITPNLEEYASVGLSLLQRPTELEALRSKLRGSLEATGTFDALAKCRELEAAFQRICRPDQ
jgi:protein O-GlcNAc transferase